SVTTRAKASSPNNKNIKIGVFVESADSYTTKIQGDATDFTDFTTEINDSNFIDSNGFIYVLSYADSSNGVTASNINTDYIGVQLMVSLNPLTVLNKSGFANEADLALKTDQTTFESHTTNQENPHSVTASQVGAYSKIESDNKFSEITDKTNEYTDAEVSEINSRLTAAINAVDEKATNNTNDLTNQVNNNKVLIQKNKDRIIGSYSVKELMSKTHYSAHRCNNADFPENSSMAMKRVFRHKFCEFDVQTTSDHKWVVMHDATVDRMTNGTGRIDEMTYEQIRALRIDAGANLATLPDWEKVIPNLDEAIKYSRMAGVIPMIEIKVDEGTTYTDAEIADFVRQLKLNNLDTGGCIVISFSEDVLRKIRELSESIEIMWVTYDMTDEKLAKCIELRMHIDPQYSHDTVNRLQVQKFHEHGLLVSVWTCPDAKFGAMEDAGVDIITTNSRSGDLRWSQLTLKNGYTGVTWPGYLPPYVEEINKGLVRLSCTVTGGSNSQNTVIAELPEWAQPYLNSAGLGMVRTSSSINQCSVDVIG
ncbi:glycerophosphodiester phosphodiesterase, partial [Enterococcus hirae]